MEPWHAIAPQPPCPQTVGSPQRTGAKMVTAIRRIQAIGIMVLSSIICGLESDTLVVGLPHEEVGCLSIHAFRSDERRIAAELGRILHATCTDRQQKGPAWKTLTPMIQ